MKLIKRRQNLLLGLALIFSLAACKQNRWNPDVSNIKANVHIARFDRALFSVDTTPNEKWIAGVHEVEKQYPEIYEAYVEQLLRIGPKDSTHTLMVLKKLVADRFWQELYRDEQKLYNDKAMDSIEHDMSDAFRHYKYYFPKDTLPQVVAILKGYNPYDVLPAMFTYENKLAISLDMYMGANYRFYEGWPIYGDYQIKRFRKEYIVPQALKTLFEAKYPDEQLTDPTLLSQAIYAGKRLFFLDAMAPDMTDTLKIEYTKEQLKWVVDNQPQMWEHFVTKDLLFTTDQRKIAKYMEDAPFTNADGVPQESSPRLGEYLGWQIVKHYMENNPDVTLQQLFMDKDYRKIMNQSKYRPK